MSNLKRPHSDDLMGLPLTHVTVPEYDWTTRVRITVDGVTIHDVVDVLDTPWGAEWLTDQFGRYGMIKPAPQADPRHASVRAFDRRMWELLLGDHSPTDEVRYSVVRVAESIAEALVTEYADHARQICADDDVTIAELTESLARVLRYDGRAA